MLLTTESDKPTFGEVVAVGSGKKAEDGKVVAPNVPVGSTVMYSKYSGTEFEVGTACRLETPGYRLDWVGVRCGIA